MSAVRQATPLLPTYARNDVTFVSGEGVWLTDDDGKRYLDLLAGIAVVSLGHRHPAPLAAAQAQLDALWHVSNLYSTEPMARLAALLSDRFGGAEAFFCNSGAEAIEAALKWARKATGKSVVVALEGSFHGRTHGALSVTGQPAKRAAFEPLAPPVRFAVPNDIASLEAAAGADVGTILVEPVLGEGGVIPLDPEFLAAARRSRTSTRRCSSSTRCSAASAGRAASSRGSSSACGRTRSRSRRRSRTGCRSAPCSSRTTLRPASSPATTRTTFGGNPVICAAACAVVEAIDDELLAAVAERGAQLSSGVAALPGVVATRGRGLLLGADLDRPAAPVATAASSSASSSAPPASARSGSCRR